MKTILYMAQSLNGYIAKDSGDSEWVGEADLQRFQEMTTNAGNVVMGRTTYEYLRDQDTFPLPGRLNVVMTREMIEPESSQVVFTQKSPSEVVDMMKDQGFSEVMVIGGGKIAKSFLDEELIDELYITIEPIILGRGIPFINRADFIEEGDMEVHLDLVDTFNISDNEIQLHYKVKK